MKWVRVGDLLSCNAVEGLRRASFLLCSAYAKAITTRSRRATSPDRVPITGRTKGLSNKSGEGDDICCVSATMVEIVEPLSGLLELGDVVGVGEVSWYVRI